MRTDVAADGVRELLDELYEDRVYSVEDGAVWVSGMNEHCPRVARDMVQYLLLNDIPCSLVYDDGAAANGGVQFNYGKAA